MNYFFRFLLICFGLLAVTCSKDDPIETKGSIYGRITENVSNEAIVAAQVSISGIQQSVSTGQDGIYQFSDITAGSYSITAAKSGYLTDVKNVTVVAGETSNGDFSLEKELPIINPTSVTLNSETTEITLQLQNTRSTVMNFTTSLSQEWLEVSPSNSSIEPLNTILLTLTADLANVPYGNYEEVLIINVGQASLSVPIVVNYTEPANISIVTPSADETYVMGQVMPINWNSNLEGSVKIELYRFSSIYLTISEEETNNNGGNYSWEIPALEEANYQLTITSIENNEIFDTTDAFNIIQGPTKPTVVNGSVTELLSTSIKIEGEITDIGLEVSQVDQYGHVYSQNNTDPNISDFKTNLGSTPSPLVYESEITDLDPGVTYYVNAYATNSQGTSYGDVITVTPPAGAPIVTTTNVTEITASSAVTGGNVTSDGGNNLTERGLCWGTTSPVNIDSNTIQDGQSTEGAFTTNLTGLNGGTTYYVRAYAINSEGVGYGEQIAFNTVNTPPVTSNISANTNEDEEVIITFSATDTEDSNLTDFTIVSNPNNGNLGSVSSTVEYTPNLNFNGTDQFTYMVTDSGDLDSNVSTVTITVNPVNDPPETTQIDIEIYENDTVDIELIGFDVDDNSLNYFIYSNPNLGNVYITGNTATYFNLSSGNFDSFTYRAFDGQLYSNPSVVNITIVEPETPGEVHIGNGQIWADKNLSVITYANGDPILHAPSESEWQNAGEQEIGAYCYLWNDEDNGELFGVLYNGFAVEDERGLAPPGWKISRLDDWGDLATWLDDTNELCGEGVSGGGMASYQNNGGMARAVATNEMNWDIMYPDDPDSAIIEICDPAYDLNLNNSTGLNIFPSGYRDDAGVFNSNVTGKNFAARLFVDVTAPGFQAETGYFGIQYNEHFAGGQAGVVKSKGYSIRLIKE